MTPKLESAVEHAYEVFAPYKNVAGGTQLNVCRCPSCVYPETEAALLSTPLREISSDLLVEYTNSGHGWDDSVIANEFRYFLPRYLDLLAHYDPPDHLGYSGSLRRMGEAEWLSKWPEDQVMAVEQYLEALFLHTMSALEHACPGKSNHEMIELYDVLELAGRAGYDVTRLLDTWDAAPDPEAAVNMAWMRQKIVWKDGTPDLYGWNESGTDAAAGPRIAAFLLREEIDKRMERAFFMTEDESWQKVLSDAERPAKS